MLRTYNMARVRARLAMMMLDATLVWVLFLGPRRVPAQRLDLCLAE